MGGGGSRESGAVHWGVGGPAQALAAHPLPPPRPGPRSPRARGSPLSRGAHTRTPRRHTGPRQPRRGGPGPVAAPGRSPPRRPPERPHPDPAPRAAAREPLHSPEFLHVCGRGLRETKREGQQAGGVRSAAAPGGAGHSGHGRARRRGAPRGSVGRKPGPRAPSPCPPAAVPETQGGAPGRGRVTGEPARAAALPSTELRPPRGEGRRGDRPGDSGWHSPGRSRSRPKRGDPARPR